MFNRNDWRSIMLSAMLVGMFAWIVGSVLGALILRSVNEQIDQHRLDNPIPDESEIYSNDSMQSGTG